MEKGRLKHCAMRHLPWMAAIFLAIGIFFACIYFNMFDNNYYQKDFSRRFDPASKAFYSNLSNQVLYFINSNGNGNGKNTDLGAEILRTREKQHLVEVRGIVTAGKRVMWESFFLAGCLLFIIYSLNKKYMKQDLRCKVSKGKGKKHFRESNLILQSWLKTAKITGLLLLGIVLVSLLIFLNFQDSFVSFHLLLFKTDTWLLNPNDALIIMYPEDFFANMAIRIITLTGLIGGLIYLAAKLYERNSLAGHWHEAIRIIKKHK